MPKTKPITKLDCDHARPGAKSYKLSAGYGLYLEIMPNGSKLWRYRYKWHGKDKRMALGAYPTVSLREARDKVETAKRDRHNGIDPVGARKEKKRLAKLNAKNTFEAIAAEWHAYYKDTWDSRHGDNILLRLKKDIFPVIGDIPIAELKATDVVIAVRKIDERGAGEMARRAMQVCGQVMRYAVQTGRAARDFVPDLKGCLKKRKKGHYAAIEVDDLPALIKKIRGNDVRLFKQTRIALELMLLTFVRTSELINAKWEEFRLKDRIWIIPAERTKMRRQHVVPLPIQACNLLEELYTISGKREHAFPSIPRPRKPMSNATLLRALEKLGYGRVMTGHGFRALAMTAIREKLEYEHKVVDLQLAHLPKSRVDRAYDRTQFIDKRTQMMQDWANYIDSLVQV